MTAQTHARNNALIVEIARRAVLGLRVPDGSRRQVVTPVDARCFAALCSFQNARTGQTTPGLRALAKRARCSVGAAADSTHRMRGAGWIDWTDQLVVVGRVPRRGRSYTLAKEPPPLRPMFASKPERKKERGLRRALAVDNSPQLQAPALSVEQQKALIAVWMREAAARPGLTMR